MNATPRQLLKPCGRSPNCVCTCDERARHHVRPVKFSGDAAGVLEMAVQVLEELGIAQVIEKQERYAHLVAISRVFKFHDDVEVAVDLADRFVHFRSSSRQGWWDFGVNRRRMDRFRQRLCARLGAEAVR